VLLEAYAFSTTGAIMLWGAIVSEMTPRRFAGVGAARSGSDTRS
jgi:hypothetical protein